MLFTARSAPQTDAARLHSVRCGLNSPVVSIAELPVGPASAVIAIHEDPHGGFQITVAVRCRRTGDVVFFGGPDAVATDSISNDAAISLAEGMGFVFDDELCEPEAGGGAIVIWQEFAGAPQEAGPIWLSKFRWLQHRNDPSVRDTGTGG